MLKALRARAFSIFFFLGVVGIGRGLDGDGDVGKALTAVKVRAIFPTSVNAI